MNLAALQEATLSGLALLTAGLPMTTVGIRPAMWKGQLCRDSYRYQPPNSDGEPKAATVRL
jgi:hypothetical protein